MNKRTKGSETHWDVAQRTYPYKQLCRQLGCTAAARYIGIALFIMSKSPSELQARDEDIDAIGASIIAWV